MADYELIQIEEYFNEQRAQARWPYKRLDPTDWAYMDAWQKDNVPFAVICRGIAETFSNHLRRNAQGKINTVRYCEGAIKKHWKDYCEAHVGSNHDQTTGHESDFGVERILEALQSWIEALQNLAAHLTHGSENIPTGVAVGAVARELALIRVSLPTEPDCEKLDARLAELETKLIAIILDHVAPETLAEMKRQAEKKFAQYKDKWMPNLWDQTIQTNIHKQLREEYGIPRMSLFYL